MATFKDFEKLEIRVGRVLTAEILEGARKPAYRLSVDFGETIGIKQSSAQITDHYTAAEVVGRQVLGVVNFPPMRIAGFKSEVLVLGVYGPEGVVLIGPEREVPLGARLG